MNYIFQSNKLMLSILVTLILSTSAHSENIKMKNEKNDWPMDRHDPQMTGHTSLKGKMLQTPEVVWKYYLGLWSNYLVVTAYSEASEILGLSAKRIEIIDLPEKPFGEGYFWEHSLDWGLRQPPVDIDGKGTLVDYPNQSSVKLAKLLPDVPGFQRVEFDNAFSIGAEENYGRMYAYDEGADKPRLVWQTERIKDMYSPVVAIADTDLDGQDEVVLLTHYHLAIYDALTGQVKDSVYWNVGRNYGQLDVVDVDGDGRPDFVVQADAPPHLEFIRNSPNGASLAWSHKYLENEADVAVPTEFYLHNLPNALRDLDGDGRMELAVNIHDFKADRRWHVVVFDVLTGEVKADFIDRYLWAVADIDSDGHFEFFLSHAPDKTIERDAKLYVSSYLGTELLQRWESQASGRFCMRPYFFPDNVNSASSRGPVNRSTIVTGNVDGDKFDEFFVMTGQKLLAVGVEQAASLLNGVEHAASLLEGYKVKFTVVSPSESPPKAIATHSQPAGISQVLVELHAESGAIQIDGASAQLKSHYQAKNFRTTPTVANLDGNGKNEIIVENAAGFIEVLDPPSDLGSPPTVRWKFRGFAQPVWVTWKTDHAPVPVVDLDGDGKKEIICCDSGNEPHTTIYALRADGSIYWKSELTEIGPRLTETFKVGRFREEGWDVLVTIQPTTQPEMLCLDGRTGEIRWHKKSWKDDKGQIWPYPNQYICYDDDGDGFHEIYGSYAYLYYVLDGNTGEPIRKPIFVHEEVFNRWQSYFTPIPADFNGDGKIEFLLASGSYAIGGLAVVTPTCGIVWEKALDNSVGARGLQGVGDCDGDGIPDIAFYHLDERIVCYDGKTGDIKWQVEGLKSHGSMSGGHFTSGDIDSDGRDEFLYPLGSNEIIALDNDAPDHILWRAHLDAEPGTPILADIDGDGLAEIIVCTTDGYLNIVK